ncbi:Ribonucleoside-diphosphate reductase [Candidatus Saccharimonas aalborgensis]|jgi:ribonucleoside-diphosphate reductase alpha chain|uniref:Ribonucleoside-diphosphate reductase n=1 Tax=Candidatus Saccharimonas aalborgensis TaxID=1332188 RepID=R4PMY9_9BACT|nr:ribonucleoside-diphosphate reductase subunit alpha [Candidatus Saccharimonas aalborgensis]AGL62274.1 Ribonucleoside-diphosphate reductase [Candidatus Saccharimonas aalborgensis]QQS68779.1 MAG: ribonucleoside-diphosphate reductase subunit alpha [Candidatus Saccharibacteria bacterium]QQS71064.1 MAG: ribonucleoside-diphosphate reductase subunit alpha [Candidatus Saccharibacteria bacterium]
MNGIHVVKRDGTREPFDANKINLALVKASEGLPDQIQKVVQVATELQLTLFDGITSEELDEAVIHTALQNVKDDPDFDTIAARLLLKNVYKNILGDYKDDAELKKLHEKAFPQYLKTAVKEGLLDKRMVDPALFDVKKLAAALDPQRDALSKYLGVITNKNRYALRKQNGEPVETPQFTHMRIAMGLSFNEKDPTAAALDFYRHMSNLDYLPGGSTRVNAGGSFPQLSNCFVIDVDDDMEAIAKSIRDTMWIAKGTGGIGISMNKLRAAGSPVKTTNTVSTGPLPFMKMIDTALFAVSRKGKKAGAAAIYMENWHVNFPGFMELRQNSGDPYFRTRFANIAVYISDEFMRRVQKEQDWYMFDPAETPDLSELYGDAFAKRYNEYVKLAKAGKLREFKTVPARQQWRQILTSLQASSHPWITWKDTINVRALNNNRSTIHSSNLCTEITLPNDEKNISVCNLVSINLSAFLDVDKKVWDWKRLEAATRSAIRQLDNLCDITDTPIPEAINSIQTTRALGLGIMGFTDVIEKLGYSYESEEAYDTMDQLAEYISYYAIDESAELAKTRGSYPDFKGSGWSKGQLPIDTVDALAKDRSVAVDVTRKTRLDWEALRKKTTKGMRNATLMAIAPTANIAHVAGTTPGIDPQFGQIFSRSTLNGKFLEVNTNLVRDLKALGIWNEVKDQLLIEQGDLTNIDTVPQHLKDVYKTCFQLSPFAFVEVAARAQKWVDQAISRNMYLESRSIDDMEKVYMGAWKRGLKTTYYLHMKPRHQAELSTVKVNKADAIVDSSGARKSGFGFAKKQAA